MSEVRAFSHGRGGAGNMGKERTASAGAQDFVTPTLKAEQYTTGRGGSGNMAKNDYGAEARTAQDVNAPVPRDPEGKVHYGRGGANVTETGTKSSGLAEKGKALLQKAGVGK